LLRADSGFWNKKIMARLQAAGWTYSIGVRQQQHIAAAITAIPERDWQPLPDYPQEGEAQIAQTMLAGQRLIIRRTRLLGDQAELWPDWRHFAFLTNRTDAIELVEAEHRRHAVVELAIRDLKDQALAHFPSGKFSANAAWTVIAALAHNLLRWTTLIGLPDTTIRAARTLRRRLLTIPGRLARVGQQRGRDGRVLRRPVPQPERVLGPVGVDAQRHHAAAALERDPVEHQHRQAQVVQRTRHELDQVLAGLGDELAADRRLLVDRARSSISLPTGQPLGSSIVGRDRRGRYGPHAVGPPVLVDLVSHPSRSQRDRTGREDHRPQVLRATGQPRTGGPAPRIS
jgi:hypothetical protein